MSQQMLCGAQSHAQGQPIETAKRDMVLRLPIVLPSKYLTTAVQQFKVGHVLFMHCSLQSLFCHALQFCMTPQGFTNREGGALWCNPSLQQHPL